MMVDFSHYPRVSKITAGIGRPFITEWAATRTARLAIEHLSRLQSLATENPDEAIEWLIGAVFDEKSGADAGNTVHRWIHRLLADTNADPPSHVRPYTDAFRRFWQHFTPRRLLGTELTVVSHTPPYLGVIDILATDADGKTVVIDIKTGKHIHPEHYLQVVAYTRAQLILNEHKPLPKVDYGLIVHLLPDGYHLHFVDTADETLWVAFLSAWLVHRWLKEQGRSTE